MKLTITSDTHGTLLEIPGTGDLFVHAGDICNNYSKDKELDAIRQSEWMLTTFLPWINEISSRFTLCVCIFGNHDRIAEYQHFLRDNKFFELLNKNVRFLTDQSVEFMGQKIYGTPWINLGDLRPNYWAYTKATADLKDIRKQIPDDTNILITHTPPYNILDEENHYGDISLNDRLHELDELTTVIMGHCHLDGGKTVEYNGITYCNSAQNVMNILL